MKGFWGGLLLMVLGILLGLFVGGYLCLYGGIVQIINGVQADPVSAGTIALGVIRILCAFLAGILAAAALILPGFAIMTGLHEKGSKRRRFQLW